MKLNVLFKLFKKNLSGSLFCPEGSSLLKEEAKECQHLLHLSQLSACVLIIAQVLLVSHQDDGNRGAEVFDLRGPLLWNVFCVGVMHVNVEKHIQ